MTLQELKNKFISSKSFEPTDLNQLMDFLQQNYLNGEVTIQHYRQLIKELELFGACKPM
ncbi:YppF family protein [Gottfriedia luciferensis]|uniref:YppF family protein n=1 Tax=Gottfriedia luciferensis TaxID=178774 RepID=UPI000B4530F9|nr:YppF family protein [Gottfriedia luciferensis]